MQKESTSAIHDESKDKKLSSMDPSVSKQNVDSRPMKEASKERAPETSLGLKTDPPLSSSTTSPLKNTDKKRRPGKLDIAAAEDATKKGSSSSKPDNGSGETAIGGGLATAPGLSQPPTPATIVSQTSAASATRQKHHKTVRKPPVPKSDTPPQLNSASPGFDLSSTPSKQASRRPSFTSIHQSGTPVSEKFSDNASYTSASMSRANSPPPSIVGTAPVRHVSKSQQKKDRQARAKLAEVFENTEKPIKAEEPVQAPIVGRKKKTKKTATQGTADSTPTATRPTSPAAKEHAEEKADDPPHVTPVKENKRSTPKTAADSREPEIPESSATPTTSETQKPPLTAASIYASLKKAGEITASISELFKGVHGLNHRFDAAPELDLSADQVPVLSGAQTHHLDQGEPIVIDKGPNNNFVILPDRTVLRGLSHEHATRYVEMRITALSSGAFPSKEALDAFLPKLTPLTTLAAAPPEVTPRSTTSRNALHNHFLSSSSSSSSHNDQPSSSGSRSGGGGGLGDDDNDWISKQVQGLSVDEAERNLLAARKETEGFEKKLNGLLKKNRRLLLGSASV